MQHDSTGRIARRQFLLAGSFATALGYTPRAEAAPPKLERYRFEQLHMGVPWELVLYANSPLAANSAADAAFARIQQLDTTLSDYQVTSELSRLNATAGTGNAVMVSDDLWSVVAAAQALSAKTEGAFDMTVGPMVRLWRRARRYKEMPRADLLAEARQAVGYQLLRLDPRRRTIELTRPNMRLDPGGIAMGYAADETLKVLRSRGVDSALIDASGDIVCGDAPPDRPGWVVGIAPDGGKSGKPTRYLSLANRSVTTSGDAFQFVELAGQRYSHIVDPRTGLGLTNRVTATIVGPSGLVADSVATAVSVLGPERGAAFIEADDTLAGHVTWLEGDQIAVRETQRLAQLVVEPRVAPADVLPR